eukprot:GHVU01097963.1.p1 GENE.GHVU01097963.1~~GHVU01097963.1.p1  ORF type:complete len:212 (+),score=15.63 GHVU01097963.1:384-1019(+)
MIPKLCFVALLSPQGFVGRVKYANEGRHGIVCFLVSSFFLSQVVASLGQHLDFKARECISGIFSHRFNPSKQELREGPQVVVGIQRTVKHAIKMAYLNVKHVKLFVVDEADEILYRGYKEQIYDSKDTRLRLGEAAFTGSRNINVFPPPFPSFLFLRIIRLLLILRSFQMSAKRRPGGAFFSHDAQRNSGTHESIHARSTTYPGEEGRADS